MEPMLDAMCYLGLYRKARLLRNRYVRPELWERSLRWHQFYSQFISGGDLVFDIGANRGDRTELFVELGARVIAVEPIAALATRLKAIYRYSPVQVEAVGVGRAAGTLPLRVCTDSECSSFSDEFIGGQARSHGDLRWERTQMVPIVTADHLIEKYGVPSFIKIDVEGFEGEVLAGLKQPVAALSFEVRPEDSCDSVSGCLERLAGLTDYEFNLSIEERLAFELPQWTNHNTVVAAFLELRSSKWNYGDIYARRRREVAFARG